MSMDSAKKESFFINDRILILWLRGWSCCLFVRSRPKNNTNIGSGKGLHRVFPNKMWDNSRTFSNLKVPFQKFEVMEKMNLPTRFGIVPDAALIVYFLILAHF